MVFYNFNKAQMQLHGLVENVEIRQDVLLQPHLYVEVSNYFQEYLVEGVDIPMHRMTVKSV